MADLFGAPEVLPARRLAGKVEQVLMAAGSHFVTAPVQSLSLDFAGIGGDHHAGLTRKAGGREPWYPRGTEIRNERQVSLVSIADLEAIAAAMGLAQVRPEWLGANIVVSGLPDFSLIPPRTLLFFEGGVTLKVDGQNAPCRSAGRAVAAGAGLHNADEVAMKFVKAAKRLRGLVAWVEKPGTIAVGAQFEARLPEQWFYRA
jgi:MOSC domain